MGVREPKVRGGKRRRRARAEIAGENEVYARLMKAHALQRAMISIVVSCDVGDARHESTVEVHESTTLREATRLVWLRIFTREEEAKKEGEEGEVGVWITQQLWLRGKKT